MTLVYDGYAGALASLDTTTVTVAAFTSSYVPSAADTTLASLTGEVSTGDAPSYARQTATVSWSATTRRLTWATDPTFDLAGASNVQHFVIADASGDLVCVLSYTAPFSGVDDFVFGPAAVAAEADQSGLEARVASLEARVTALEGP